MKLPGKSKPRPLCAETHPKLKDKTCLRQAGHKDAHQATIFAIRPNADGTDWIDRTHPLSMSWAKAKDAYAVPKDGIVSAPYFSYDMWVMSLKSRIKAGERLVELSQTEPSKKYWHNHVAGLKCQLYQLEISSGL